MRSRQKTGHLTRNVITLQLNVGRQTDEQTHETDLVAPLKPLTSMQASRICSSVRISPTLVVAKLQLSLSLINQVHYKDRQGSETTVSTLPTDPNHFGFSTPIPLKPGRDAERQSHGFVIYIYIYIYIYICKCVRMYWLSHSGRRHLQAWCLLDRASLW